MYCGLCVEVCPPKSLVHTAGYEKAMFDRGEMVLQFVHEDPAGIKARVAKQVAEAAAKAAEATKAAETAKAAEAAKAPVPEAANQALKENGEKKE
jgi:formate hydrogenlyase subunit 6/NADH:ubiquinone oxidoreductase subunit I